MIRRAKKHNILINVMLDAYSNDNLGYFEGHRELCPLNEPCYRVYMYFAYTKGDKTFQVRKDLGCYRDKTHVLMIINQEVQEAIRDYNIIPIRP